MSTPGPAAQVVFDLTGSWNRAGRRPTGIERVEMDLAEALAARSPVPVTWVRYDVRAGRFFEIGDHERRSLTRELRGDQVGTRAATASTTDVADPALARRRVRDTVQRLLAGGEGGEELARAVVQELTDAAVALFRARDATVRLVRHRWRARARVGPRGRTSACASARWGPSTVYVNAGLPQRDGDLRYLVEIARRTGARVVVTIHDVIPIVTPQFEGGRCTVDLRPVSECDVVLVNSEYTGASLRRVLNDELGLRAPTIVVLPMSSSLHTVAPVRPPLPFAADEPFVLNVGTVSLRKNLHLLFDVWERLVAERGDRTPHLVIAGDRGWNNAETLSRLRYTPELQGRVHHLEHVPDAGLAWLVRHAVFTAFPSFHEGWGLPVTESLDLGTLCLASDRTSVPEAGEGLAILLDPTDRGAWYRTIVELLDDPDARAVMERRIAAEHHVRTPADAADVVVDVVRELSVAPAR